MHAWIVTFDAWGCSSNETLVIAESLVDAAIKVREDCEKRGTDAFITGVRVSTPELNAHKEE